MIKTHRIIIEQTPSDYNTKMKQISALSEKYPFISVGEAGKSVCGRRIPLLKVGQGANKVLFSAAYHGNERITATVILGFLENLSEAYFRDTKIGGKRAVDIFESTELYILPLVNPDGCEISLKGETAANQFESSVKKISGQDYDNWTANARGVDINHNFNAGWNELRQLEKKQGIYGPSPRRYGGTRPESEPETVAVCDLCRRVEFNSSYAFHTQGEVIYWKYNGIHIDGAAKKAVKLAELSGYALDAPSGIAVGGGFKDWFITEFSRPSFTVELSKGKNPLPDTSSKEILGKVENMLVYAIS